ncbi:MAG: hypothetical protein WBV69_16240 [Candidatus Sulfotelmatobacter sp.]
MGFLKDLFLKQRYPAILLLTGVLLVFGGNYSVSGKVTEPQLRERPRIILNIFGALLIVVSVGLFLIDEDFVAYRRGCKISNTENGFEAKFRDSNLSVDFGLLQELYQPTNSGSAVVLPANEFFDERCFSDDRTAAGAFIGKYFSPLGASELKDLVHLQLRGHDCQSVPTGAGTGKQSYGVGTCVYLGQPLGQPVRMIFAAVASEQPPHGLRTDLSTIFKAVEEVKCNLASERLTAIFVPVLGAGKGGVPAEIAFMTLVSALLEARCRDGGHHLREMHIVIFQGEGKAPQIPHRKAKRALRQLVSLYQQMSE